MIAPEVRKSSNPAALADLLGAWTKPVHARKSQATIMLQIDSSVRETHGAEDFSAGNGHFGRTSDQPLFHFYQSRDLEPGAPRFRNVHFADGWREVPEPVSRRNRHCRRDCRSPAVAPSQMSRTASAGDRRVWRREKHTRIPACRWEYPPSGPSLRSKKVVEPAVTEEFVGKKLRGVLPFSIEERTRWRSGESRLGSRQQVTAAAEGDAPQGGNFRTKKRDFNFSGEIASFAVVPRDIPANWGPREKFWCNRFDGSAPAAMFFR